MALGLVDLGQVDRFLDSFENAWDMACQSQLAKGCRANPDMKNSIEAARMKGPYDWADYYFLHTGATPQEAFNVILGQMKDHVGENHNLCVCPGSGPRGGLRAPHIQPTRMPRGFRPINPFAAMTTVKPNINPIYAVISGLVLVCSNIKDQKIQFIAIRLNDIAEKIALNDDVSQEDLNWFTDALYGKVEGHDTASIIGREQFYRWLDWTVEDDVGLRVVGPNYEWSLAEASPDTWIGIAGTVVLGGYALSETLILGWVVPTVEEMGLLTFNFVRSALAW